MRPAASPENGRAMVGAEAVESPSIESPSVEASAIEASAIESSEAARVLVAEARALADAGDLEAARACCERALQIDKMHAGFYHLHATILQEQGELAGAAMALRRALYLDHNFIAAHFALGNLARREGKTRHAHKHFDNALRLLRAADPAETVPESGGRSAADLIAFITFLESQ